jgi:hypothetical protein
LAGTDELTPRRRLRVIDTQRVLAEREYIRLYEAIVDTEEDVDQRLLDLVWWLRLLVREERLVQAELDGETPPQLALCEVW